MFKKDLRPRLRPRLRGILATATAVALTTGLAACSDNTGDGTGESSSGDGSWPRTVSSLAVKNHHLDCTNQLDISTCATEDVVIPAQPQRIVSTAVGLTGTLLAVDAPVTATGGATRGSTADNDEGVFNQWADEAREKGGGSLWQLSPDLEKIVNADPDLILVAANGQDSAVTGIEKIQAIGVPVVVIDYVNMDWKELTTEIGEITGREADAAARISEFDQRVDEVKNNINDPEQPVSLVLPSADKSGNANYMTAESPQGRVAAQLGWDLTVPDDVARSDGPFAGRTDVRQVTAENQDKAFVGHTVLAIDSGIGEDPAEYLKSLPILNGTYAVQNDRVYTMPPELFRMDYYSAMMMLNRVDELFVK
ncbi:Fe2+-enterobactin ABC transporter substrate-binding protein [Corynebacterium neomassiliense]|uniref:Fe2+-enterobactin ABC transporter substrate-binding protein n=1 Tax=Corynebacterium neomassiliense TaxID=2079482 RepID=UPI001030A4AB|nr:Fe2+-enterobactin ABC transporter substrate-binding protein [Corynebacterium neomassiliense]